MPLKIIQGKQISTSSWALNSLTASYLEGYVPVFPYTGSAVTSSFISSSTWTFVHNLGTRTPTITVFDTDYNQVIPQNIQLVDTASATIDFPSLESGFVVASTVGTAGTAISSSYSLFSTLALTASAYLEKDPIFVSKSGSLATTGSNTYIGSQNIVGALNVSGALTLGDSILPISGAMVSLGSPTNAFQALYVHSSSLHILSDTEGLPETVLSNIGGNLIVSAGGMALVGSSSFSAITGSFQYISGSMTQVGPYVRVGDTNMSGSFTTIGNNSLQGNTVLNGNITITGSAILSPSSSIRYSPRIPPGNISSVTVDFSRDTILHIHTTGYSVLNVTCSNFTTGSEVEMIVVNNAGSTQVNMPSNILGTNLIAKNGAGNFWTMTKPAGYFKFICIDGSVDNTFVIGSVN